MRRALIASRRRRARGERGETLAEILVTIAILGVAITALIAGLADGILASAVHRQHATADTALRSAVETLKDRNLAWNAAGSYSVSAPSGFGVTVNASCWNGDAPPTFAACPNGDRGLQRLTVTVAGGKVVQNVTIDKRRT
jgi:type II secretory pathway pseudopilin PulG